MTSAEQVVPAVAGALRFNFGGARPPEEQLATYLAEKELLLVLDNAEHLLPRAGEVVAALAEKAPGVKFLVTSRVRLNLRAEKVYRVEGMPFGRDVLAEDFEEWGAVRLFVEAARRVEPAFVLRAEDRPAVVALCGRVKGSPLALELAASWVRVLSVAEVAAEVERAVEVLATAAADVPERHRSVAAVFNYSYDLLGGEEKRALLRLTCFRGGFTREAAAAVAGVTLSVLTSLVDKSLVARGEEGRFDLHELVRATAAERFRREDAGAWEETQDRHAAYYLSFLADRGKDLDTARFHKPLAEVKADWPNILAAWRRAVGRRLIGDLAPALHGFYKYHVVTSKFRDGKKEFETAVEGLRLSAPAEPTARKVVGAMQGYLGNLSFFLGELQEAERLSRVSLAAAVRVRDDSTIMMNIHTLALTAQFLGNAERGRRLTEYMLKKARAAGDGVNQYLALSALGFLAVDAGDRQRTKEYFTAAAHALPDDAHPRLRAAALINLISTELVAAHNPTFWQMVAEAEKAAREAGNPRVLAFTLLRRGEVAALSRAYGDAARYYREALGYFKDMGDTYGYGYVLTHLPLLKTLQGKEAEGARFFKEARNFGWGLTAFREIKTYFPHLGAYAFLMADQKGGVHFIRRFFETAGEKLEADLKPRVLAAGAAFFAARGRYEEAAAYLTAASIGNFAEVFLTVRLVRARIREHLSPAAFRAALRRGREVDAGSLIAAFRAAVMAEGPEDGAPTML